MRDYVLAVLAAGKVPSRTMLQKLVYLLGRIRRDDLPFEAYLYGPYSRELQEILEDLTSAGLVEESRVSLAPWEPAPFDPVQYCYRLTDQGRTAAAEVEGDLLSGARVLAESAKRQRAWSQGALAAAAKLRHIRDVKPDAQREDIPTLAREFGWRVTTADVAIAQRLLAELGLATA